MRVEHVDRGESIININKSHNAIHDRLRARIFSQEQENKVYRDENENLRRQIDQVHGVPSRQSSEAVMFSDLIPRAQYSEIKSKAWADLEKKYDLMKRQATECERARLRYKAKYEAQKVETAKWLDWFNLNPTKQFTSATETTSSPERSMLSERPSSSVLQKEESRYARDVLRRTSLTPQPSSSMKPTSVQSRSTVALNKHSISTTLATSKDAVISKQDVSEKNKIAIALQEQTRTQVSLNIEDEQQRDITDNDKESTPARPRQTDTVPDEIHNEATATDVDSIMNASNHRLASATAITHGPETHDLSTQSTEGEAEVSERQLMSDEDDSLPMIVSERNLRRGHQLPTPQIKREATPLGSRIEPLTVKDEYSSPIMPPTVSRSVQSNLDLDEVQGDIDTPKKRRKLNGSFLLESAQESLELPLAEDTTPKRHNEFEALEGFEILHSIPRAGGGSKANPKPSIESSDGSLDYKSSNFNQSSIPYEGTIAEPRKQSMDLASDIRGPTTKTTESARKRRLVSDFNNCFNNGSNAMDPISGIDQGSERSIEPTRSISTSKPQTPTTLPKPARPALQTISRNAPNSAPPIKRAHHTRPTAKPFRPLRHLPIQDLHPDDFKINPVANKGLDYAFTDTIRLRNERACLPGCTRPDCCGGVFLKAAELGSTKLSRVDEDNLLRDFLGPSYTELQPALRNDAERGKLLAKAQAAKMAQSFGRHRARFERAKTPPGYWRTGFPNTQELAQDREEEARREREKVEERRREALRPGGLWLFRDE